MKSLGRIHNVWIQSDYIILPVHTPTHPQICADQSKIFPFTHSLLLGSFEIEILLI